jgi:hypothetical protein
LGSAPAARVPRRKSNALNGHDDVPGAPHSGDGRNVHRRKTAQLLSIDLGVLIVVDDHMRFGPKFLQPGQQVPEKGRFAGAKEANEKHSVMIVLMREAVANTLAVGVPQVA